MRTLNKKMMTLACATCLTVGMGAVACADTVDLGYGMYGSTSPMVKAVEVMHVPTDAKLRNNEQNQMLFAANKEVVNAINANLKWHSSVPVNPIKERDYKQTGKDEVYAFKNKLEKNGINVTIRREMGRDIDGACGQLRNKYMEDVDESNGDY